MAVTIHQPGAEVFALIDKLIVMGAGGRMLYQGPAAEAAGFFGVGPLPPPPPPLQLPPRQASRVPRNSDGPLRRRVPAQRRQMLAVTTAERTAAGAGAAAAAQAARPLLDFFDGPTDPHGLSAATAVAEVALGWGNEGVSAEREEGEEQDEDEEEGDAGRGSDWRRPQAGGGFNPADAIVDLIDPAAASEKLLIGTRRSAAPASSASDAVAEDSGLPSPAGSAGTATARVAVADLAERYAASGYARTVERTIAAEYAESRRRRGLGAAQGSEESLTGALCRESGGGGGGVSGGCRSALRDVEGSGGAAAAAAPTSGGGGACPPRPPAAWDTDAPAGIGIASQGPGFRTAVCVVFSRRVRRWATAPAAALHFYGQALGVGAVIAYAFSKRGSVGAGPECAPGAGVCERHAGFLRCCVRGVHLDAASPIRHL